MTLNEKSAATAESPLQSTSVDGDQDRPPSQPIKNEETPDKPASEATINLEENTATTTEPRIALTTNTDQTINKVKREECTDIEHEIKHEHDYTPADTPATTSNPVADPYQAILINDTDASNEQTSEVEQSQVGQVDPLPLNQTELAAPQPISQEPQTEQSSAEHTAETLPTTEPVAPINAVIDSNDSVNTAISQSAKGTDIGMSTATAAPPIAPEQSTTIQDAPMPHSSPATTQIPEPNAAALEPAQPIPVLQQQDAGQQPLTQSAETANVPALATTEAQTAAATNANGTLSDNQAAPNQNAQSAPVLQAAQQPLSPSTTTTTTAQITPAAAPAAIVQASAPIPADATTAQPMVSDPSGPAIIAPPPQPATTFEEIQKQLKATLDHIEQRNMVSGFQTLSKATGAVVDSCEHLGLTSDDHPYNAIDREQFWAGLNNCWLYALAQRQEPRCDAERLTDQHLYNLREMVVTWADKLERYGLVDYEMGWWEADILSAIDGILAMNYAAAQAAAQAVVAQAAAAFFGDDVNM